MNQIIVSRTHIKITDYEPGMSPWIENTFSIWNPSYHRRDIMGMHYDRDTRVLYVPRGTPVEQLERIFNTVAITDYSHTPIRNIGKVGLTKGPRDEDQKEALRFMIGADKYAYTINKPMLHLNLNTGKGKSYCSVATTAFNEMASIIITDGIGVLDQWYNYFLEYTDIKPNEIYYITGSPSIQKLFKRDLSQYKIFLATHGTINSYAGANGWPAVGDLFAYLGIGLKFYDEAHKCFDNMCMIDFYSNVFKTFYITATPHRSDSFEENIYQLYFNGTPSINLFKIDEDPHTMYAGILYNSHPSPMDIEACKSNYGMDRNAYTDYVVRQPNFHKMLHILINQAINKPGKSLWYIGTNSAIMYVRNWIYENYPELVGSVGVYTSIVPPEKKKQQLERKIILSTTKSAGAAMDITDLVETVPLAEPFKSKVLAQQTLGRTRASNTIYKEVVDVGFPTIRRFYNTKKPVFMKYATDCKEIMLKDAELDRRANEILKKRENAVFPIIFFDDTFENLPSTN